MRDSTASGVRLGNGSSPGLLQALPQSPRTDTRTKSNPGPLTPCFDNQHLQLDLYHYLDDEDYAWLTRELVAIADANKAGVISVLEGCVPPPCHSNLTPPTHTFQISTFLQIT
jgi:hypothetical protein